MNAVAFAAGKLADFFLLIGALEVERRTIRARIDFTLSKLQLIKPPRYLFPDRLLTIKRVARLVDIAEVHRFTDLDRALIRFLLRGDHPEQRGLAGAVRTDHADDAAGRQLESQFVDEKIVAETFADIVKVDHVLTEPLRDRNDDLRALSLLLPGLLQQLF